MRTVQFQVPIEWEEKIKERMQDRQVNSVEQYIHNLIEWDLPSTIDYDTELKLLEAADGPFIELPASFFKERADKMRRGEKIDPP